MEDLILSYGTDEELNELEKIIKEDDVEALKRLEIILVEPMTEICAFFGASKCLLYMQEQGVEISHLINLYAIMNNHRLPINIPHDDELKMCLMYKRIDRLKEIDLPDIDIALNVMSYAVYYCSFRCDAIDDDVDDPLADPIKLIYDLYSPCEWEKVLKGKARYELLRYGRLDILEGIKPTIWDYMYLKKHMKKYEDCVIPSFPEHYGKQKRLNNLSKEKQKKLCRPLAERYKRSMIARRQRREIRALCS
jgi:hypothetical protein